MGNVVNLYWKLDCESNGISQLLKRIEQVDGIFCRESVSLKNINTEDIYIIHGCYSIYLIKYFIILFLSRCRFYWCPHGSLQKNTFTNNFIKKYIFHYFISSLVYVFSEGVIYVSDQERKRSLNYFQKKSKVIVNGLEEINNNLLIKKNINTQDFVYIGRLDPYHKGLDRMAKWAAPLGESLKVYGPYNDEVQKKIPSLNFKGPVFGDDKMRILLKARALIMLSRYEGLPVVAIEALRTGTPVILTDECNMSDVVYKYNCGFIVKSQNELLEACSFFSEIDYETFLQYSKNAIRAFHDCYTLEKMITGYKSLA